MITVGSLFSGIGGIDLGLERAGMTVKWQSEIDPYACKVLKKHWPDIPNLGDIKQIDWSTVEPVDIIAGGYPCQPFSTAGKRQGENDPRHLWPYFRDAISGIQPRFAILENVRGHLSMGFDRVLADLTEIGYDAEWQIVSAASVGAPHRRERIICVAYPTQQYSNGVFDYARNSPQPQTIPELGNNSGSENVVDTNGTPRQQQQKRQVQESDIGRRSQDVAYPNDTRGGTSRSDADRHWEATLAGWNDQPQSQPGRLSEIMANTHSDNTPNGGQRQGLQGEDTSWRDDGSGSGSDIGQVSMGSTRQNSCNVADTTSQQRKESLCTGARIFASSNAWRSSSDGRPLSDWWAVEPDVGRVADGVPARLDRLKGLGNAVVPQVAEYVGRLIMQSLT